MLNINYTYLNNDRRYIKKCVKKYLRLEISRHQCSRDVGWLHIFMTNVKSNTIKNIMIEYDSSGYIILIWHKDLLSYINKTHDNNLSYIDKLNVIDIRNNNTNDH